MAAGLYLWFTLAWGYNYRRPGVEAALPRFSAARVTPEALRALAERAVLRSNELHAEAHAQGFPAAHDVPSALLDSLHDVEHSLGRTRPTMPSVPKRPITAPYMRAVGVSGMLAPLMLETYLNPDLTGPERPYVLAHEWAHLSGFAPEEDASFRRRRRGASRRRAVAVQRVALARLRRGDAVADAGAARSARAVGRGAASRSG